MVAFRTEADEVSDEEDSVVRFYFSMFDFDNHGKIGLDQMQLVVRCIFADTTGIEPPDSLDIQAMFEAMDTKKTGYIDFEEFKRFYETVLISSARAFPTH
jgi:Ca2+-binding EF-hand superfamily protein